MDDRDVGRAYQLFQRDLVRMYDGNVGGIRVFEPHPGGHGLHVHVLLNRRVNVHQVKRLTRKHGLGRDDVQDKVGRDAAQYLCKYLWKGGPTVSPGVRRWASFGAVRKVRVKNVHVDSSEAEHMRILTAGKKMTYNQYIAAYAHVRSVGYT